MEHFIYLLTITGALFLIFKCTLIIKKPYLRAAEMRCDNLMNSILKNIPYHFKTFSLVATAFCIGLITIINLEAAQAIGIEIEYFKYFIINQLLDSQNEFYSLQDIIFLHGYAIASSSCFLLGLYFISTSGKFN
jgi:hypothetical protein